MRTHRFRCSILNSQSLTTRIARGRHQITLIGVLHRTGKRCLSRRLLVILVVHAVQQIPVSMHTPSIWAARKSPTNPTPSINHYYKHRITCRGITHSTLFLPTNLRPNTGRMSLPCRMYLSTVTDQIGKCLRFFSSFSIYITFGLERAMATSHEHEHVSFWDGVLCGVFRSESFSNCSTTQNTHSKGNSHLG
jgi:hypothetical protein